MDSNPLSEKFQILNIYQKCTVFLVLALSLWGIGNILYWEVYKGYPACAYCKWHRFAYILLFLSTIGQYIWRAGFLKLMMLCALSIELIVSSIQLLGVLCELHACRRISFIDKLNFTFVMLAFALFTFYVLLEFKKNRSG